MPRVVGIDDFALKRRNRCATVIINAETGERIDVLPGRPAPALAAWLREHPGIEYICRDGSGPYGEAIREALPEAVQVSDRWTSGPTCATGSWPRSAPTPPAGPSP